MKVSSQKEQILNDYMSKYYIICPNNSIQQLPQICSLVRVISSYKCVCLSSIFVIKINYLHTNIKIHKSIQEL